MITATNGTAPPETLSDVCRCTHARRFHRSSDGGITVACQGWHPNVPEYEDFGCYFFEANSWWLIRATPPPLFPGTWLQQLEQSTRFDRG